ncbi:hypothetical protein ACFX13_010054 [Malus domestica]
MRRVWKWEGRQSIFPSTHPQKPKNDDLASHNPSTWQPQDVLPRHPGSPKPNPSSGQPQTKARRYTEWRERSDYLQEIMLF